MSTIEYTPESLRFLVRERSDIQKRTIRISETSTEIIEINNITVNNDLPITIDANEIRDENKGIRNYILEISLNAIDLSAGEYIGDIEIVTTSKYHNNIIIPVQIEVKPIIEPKPEYLSFILKSDSPKVIERTINLKSNSNEQFEIMDVKSEEFCEFDIISNNEILIKLNTDGVGNEKGVHKWIIKLLVKMKEIEENIEVKCLALKK